MDNHDQATGAPTSAACLALTCALRFQAELAAAPSPRCPIGFDGWGRPWSHPPHDHVAPPPSWEARGRRTRPTSAVAQARAHARARGATQVPCVSRVHCCKFRLRTRQRRVGRRGAASHSARVRVRVCVRGKRCVPLAPGPSCSAAWWAR